MRKGVGRRAASLATLVVGIIITVTWVTAGGASSMTVPDAATAQDASTAQTEVATFYWTAPFSAKPLRKCPGNPCKAFEQVPTNVDTSFIAISSDDEITVNFHGSASPGVSFFIGENRSPQQAISLPVAVPLDQWTVTCENEATRCNGTITIVGMQHSAG